MGTVISSAGTLSRITKNCQQRKIFYDGTRWWAFYFKSGTANTLFYAYSSDLSAWTEASKAITSTDAQDGGELTLVFDAGSSTILVSTYNSTGSYYYQYYRGVISGTAITWGGPYDFDTTSGKAASSDYGTSLAIATGGANAGKIVAAICDSSGNITWRRSVHAISSSFADDHTAGGQWTGLTDISLTNYSKRTKLLSIGANGTLIFWHDTSGGNPKLRWGRITDTGTALTTSPIDLFTADANADPLQWGACRISDSFSAVLAITASSTFGFYKHDGSTTDTSGAISSLSAPSWPTNGLATNSGVTLISDGTDVWAFVIRGDASKTLAYNKYTAGSNSWGGWIDIEATTSGTDVSAAYAVASSKAVVMYTKTNGGNYDLVVTSVSLGGGGGGPVIPVFMNSYKQRWA